jgi:hypothetical protein
MNSDPAAFSALAVLSAREIAQSIGVDEAEGSPSRDGVKDLMVLPAILSGVVPDVAG